MFYLVIYLTLHSEGFNYLKAIYIFPPNKAAINENT